MPNAVITSADADFNSVTLTWEPVANAMEYEIYCYDETGIVSRITTINTKFTIDGLDREKYYGFIVASTVYGEQSLPSVEDMIVVETDGGEIGEKPDDHTHSFSEEWTSDSASHWHECACGER